MSGELRFEHLEETVDVGLRVVAMHGDPHAPGMHHDVNALGMQRGMNAFRGRMAKRHDPREWRGRDGG